MTKTFVEKPGLAPAYKAFNKLKGFMLAGSVVAILILGTLSSAVANNGYEAEVEQVQTNQQMWDIAADQESSSSLDVADRLGRELRDHLLEGGTPEEFRGRSQTFRGINDEVGYQVFADDSSCNECGRLSQESLDAYEFVASEGSAPTFEVPVSEGSPMAPFALGGLVGFLIAGTIAHILAMKGLWDMPKKEGASIYDQPIDVKDLLWSVNDIYRSQVILSWILSPIGHLVMIPTVNRQRNSAKAIYQDFFVAKGFDDDIVKLTEAIAHLDNKPGELTRGEQAELQNLRDTLAEVMELPSKWPTGSYSGSEAASEAASLTTEVHDRIAARLQVAEEMGV